MKAPTQKQIQKFPRVSKEELAQTSNSMRNYLVYIGESFATYTTYVHCGFGSDNHLETIQSIVKDPVFKVLRDNRKSSVVI